jgi:CHAT domain-containing protein
VLSLLPLHAAGLPEGPSALDRVVSSYAPTIRALLQSRRARRSTAKGRLAVTMRYTEGLPELPATADEAAHLRAVRLADGEATAAAVLQALPEAAWVHFACHASGRPDRASASGLHLHDRVLHVPEISRARPRGGELAYLSACSTGRGGYFQADEAVHLASAFQLAGYRHVIATLWPVNDQVAAMAARRFYRLLGDDPGGAAAALHDVARHLRRRFPDDPRVWAAFVHSGP